MTIVTMKSGKAFHVKMDREAVAKELAKAWGQFTENHDYTLHTFELTDGRKVTLMETEVAYIEDDPDIDAITKKVQDGIWYRYSQPVLVPSWRSYHDTSTVDPRPPSVTCAQSTDSIVKNMESLASDGIKAGHLELTGQEKREIILEIVDGFGPEG